MIGITISGNAYAAIASVLPTSSTAAPEIKPDGEYGIWLPQAAVIRLLALREPGETFRGLGAKIKRAVPPNANRAALVPLIF
jgi:hypothetical protein